MGYKNSKQKDMKLANEIKQHWRVQQVTIVAIVLVSTFVLPKTLKNGLKVLNQEGGISSSFQKASAPVTCHIPRKFPSF
jgi:hypothetical protein